MIVKGKARSGASDLAAHLLRTDQNERVSVVELRGVAASGLDAALREMAAHSAGTRCARPLYHASVNTAPGELLDPLQAMRAIDRLERELGLAGQPRAIVQHVKNGRTHLHAVWDRIDLAQGKAIHDGHNYRRHETVARALEREFCHARIQGAHVERQGRQRPARTPSHAEMQQAARTGLTPQQAKAAITRLWRASSGGQGFAAALHAEGWMLARGDRRDFVLLDPAGELHGLSRRIEGATAAMIRVGMADLDPASLPTVAEARTAIGQAEAGNALRIAQEGFGPVPASGPSPAPKALPEGKSSPSGGDLPLLPPSRSGQARLYAGFRRAKGSLTHPRGTRSHVRFRMFSLPEHRPKHGRAQPVVRFRPGRLMSAREMFAPPVNLTALTPDQRRERQAAEADWQRILRGMDVDADYDWRRMQHAISRECDRIEAAKATEAARRRYWHLRLMRLLGIK